MDKIPCKNILDFETAKDFACMQMQKRRLCVKFEKLTIGQKISLQSIIQKYTNKPFDLNKEVF